VREHLEQYETPPAICCSGEETPNLIATYNEALAGAASQLLLDPSARTMPLEELAAIFEDGCDRTADVHFRAGRTGVVLGTWDVAHCRRGSHDYPPVGFFVFDREDRWWDMGRSGPVGLVVPTTNGWVVTVNLSTSGAYAPFQVRHIRRVGDGWEMKVLYDYYTGTTRVEDGYRHLVVGFDLAYILPPCEFVPEIEEIIWGIPTAHDGTVVFEWDGDGATLPHHVRGHPGDRRSTHVHSN